MPTLTAEKTVRNILDMYYITFFGGPEEEELIQTIVRVLEGHDTTVQNGRSSEAFQAVSEYIAESWDNDYAFGAEIACYLFYALGRYDELSEDEKRIFSGDYIDTFTARYEDYRAR